MRMRSLPMPALATIRQAMRAVVRRALARVPQPLKLATSLVALLLSVLLALDLVGLDVDTDAVVADARKATAESLTVQLSMLASDSDYAGVERAVAAFVSRNEDVLAAALYAGDDDTLAAFGDRRLLQAASPNDGSTRMSVPILRGSSPWGEVRIVFVASSSVAAGWLWTLALALASLVSFALFLDRALVQLDPGRSVPGRVESAFDLFSAGVLILDGDLRIVMANAAADSLRDGSERSLLGTSLDAWPWIEEDEDPSAPSSTGAPWKTTLYSGLSVSDRVLRLRGDGGETRRFSVSCSRVGNEEDGLVGVLVTLDDMTEQEVRNNELAAALTELRRAEEVNTSKTLELERLATTDPLTGVANRRVLVERLEHEFAKARREGLSLAAVMCDIDHFKSVNDTHGHSVGDDVIVAVSAALTLACRDYDLVGRYGGEEFVLVLPGLDSMAASEVAERVRVAVIAIGAREDLPIATLSASFGVASLEPDGTDETADASRLVEQADLALYSAKQSGRNRVVVHDRGVVSLEVLPAVEPVAASDEDRVKARVYELETLVRQRGDDIEALREFDHLTGVPMRSMFLQRLDMELTRGERLGCSVGVLSFELRDLHRVLSIYGHATVDAMIIEFVERIGQGLRSTDLVSDITGNHSVSRIMSNEFGVLLSDLADESGAMIVVARLRRLLGKPFAISGDSVYLGANIGIAISSEDCTDAVKLLGQANDARQIAAVKPDKVSHGFATPGLEARARDYILLESQLHEAIDNASLQVYYQPKIDLGNGKVSGFEALLRWQHPERGFVRPDVFIAVAEANGMIDALSEFVLGTVLERLLAWDAIGQSSVSVAINVSPMQFNSAGLVDETLSAIEASGLSGERLQIELTETSVLDEPERARQDLERLRAGGVRVSLDDFGAGFTSLSQLSSLPLDSLKIDRSFVAAIESDPRMHAIVASVIAMAHALDLSVVAEGIETNEQLAMLDAMDCDHAQGYLIGRPMPAAEATTFLLEQERGRRRRA